MKTIDKDKIIIMTQLAIHDKYYSDRDKKADKYFKRDFVYRKNIANRISIIIGCALIFAVYWFKRIFNDDIDLLTMDYKDLLFKTIAAVTAVLILYSVVGFIKYSGEYSQSKNRMKKYNSLLSKLERSKHNQSTEEDTYLSYGELISNSRKHNQDF